jgi:hypothetical protein
MSIYDGSRDADGVAHVTVDGRPLELRLDLWAHSPTGFEWSYGGSGPAQLALAILAHHLGAKGPCSKGAEEALTYRQAFKWRVVAGLPHEEWSLTSNQVAQHLQALRAARVEP